VRPSRQQRTNTAGRPASPRSAAPPVLGIPTHLNPPHADDEKPRTPPPPGLGTPALTPVPVPHKNQTDPGINPEIIDTANTAASDIDLLIEPENKSPGAADSLPRLQRRRSSSGGGEI